MENNELILSEYKIGVVVFYIMDCRIIEKVVMGKKASMVKQSKGGVRETLSYKIDITQYEGWVSPDKLFATKIKAGEYLLSLSGLTIGLK